MGWRVMSERTVFSFGPVDLELVFAPPSALTLATPSGQTPSPTPISLPDRRHPPVPAPVATVRTRLR